MSTAAAFRGRLIRWSLLFGAAIILLRTCGIPGPISPN